MAATTDWKFFMNGPDRRSRIISSAWDLFSNLGYKATTMDAIARAAGIGKGTFYNYFATKDDVLFALVDLAGSSWASTVDSLLAASGHDMPRLVRSYLENVVAYRDQYRIYRNLVFEATTFGTPAVVEAVHRLDGRFASEICRILSHFEDRQLLEPIDKEPVAIAIMAAYSALIEARDTEGSPFSAFRVTCVMESLVSGLLNTRGDQPRTDITL